jgi:GxxExxY protein
LLYKEKTDLIINAFYKVYNRLGYGFLERVYHNSFIVELQKNGFDIKSEYPIKVTYEGVEVGDYFADIIVDNCIIIEVKATKMLQEEHEFQLINYLKATEMEVGLLFNFGRMPSFKRKLFTNDRKKQ